jgi:hypothetical protein
MEKWINIGGLVLFLLVLSLYGLFRDKDPHSMNPRPYMEEERENYLKFSRNNFAVFAVASVIVFLLTKFVRWIWMR